MARYFSESGKRSLIRYYRSIPYPNNFLLDAFQQQTANVSNLVYDWAAQRNGLSSEQSVGNVALSLAFDEMMTNRHWADLTDDADNYHLNVPVSDEVRQILSPLVETSKIILGQLPVNHIIGLLSRPGNFCDASVLNLHPTNTQGVLPPQQSSNRFFNTIPANLGQGSDSEVKNDKPTKQSSPPPRVGTSPGRH